MTKTNKMLKNKRGEAYIDTAFKILIAIVVGALLFTSIYALFNDTILTNLTSRVNTLFSTGTSLNLAPVTGAVTSPVTEVPVNMIA